MKTLFINICIIGAIILIGYAFGRTYSSYNNTNDNKSFIVKNNSTRDYNYEHYCDSIYEVDPDYYMDVLVETDEFQNYINEHGEWWTN